MLKKISGSSSDVYHPHLLDKNPPSYDEIITVTTGNERTSFRPGQGDW